MSHQKAIKRLWSRKEKFASHQRLQRNNQSTAHVYDQCKVGLNNNKMISFVKASCLCCCLLASPITTSAFQLHPHKSLPTRTTIIRPTLRVFAVPEQPTLPTLFPEFATSLQALGFVTQTLDSIRFRLSKHQPFQPLVDCPNRFGKRRWPICCLPSRMRLLRTERY